MVKIICIDFDGVLHSYTSPWESALVIKDGPTDGAISWLKSLIDDPEFDPQIYSSRSKEEGACTAMKAWLIQHGLDKELADNLKFPTQKPAAFMTVDDRVFHFEGQFPKLSFINNFKAWNKKAKSNETKLEIVLKVNGMQKGSIGYVANGIIQDDTMLGLLFDGMFKRVSVKLEQETPPTQPAKEEPAKVEYKDEDAGRT